MIPLCCILPLLLLFLLGVACTFILGWSAGYLAAGIYNCSLKVHR